MVISDVAQFLTHTLPVGRITATNWSAGIRGVGSLDACVGGAFWSVFSCLEALHCDRLLITCIQGFAGREECSLCAVSAARSSSPQSMVEMSRAPHVGCSRQLKAAAARGEADAVPRCGVRVSPPLAVVNFAIDRVTRLLGGSRRKWYQENPCIVPVRLVAKSGGQEVPVRGWRSEKREPKRSACGCVGPLESIIFPIERKR